jgi:aspartyl protease family protein
MKWIAYCIAVGGLGMFSAQIWASAVAVVGLFKDKAILRVDGGPPKTLAAGQTVGGVKLISATSESAVIEVDGKRRTLLMGQSFANVPSSNLKPTVMLSEDPSGHFFSQGEINGVAVSFLLDTGATSVAIGAQEAKRMNLDYDASAPIMVGTAAGAEKAWKVMFNTVKVGGISLNMVAGYVLDANVSPALLGMSFLNRTDMKREGQTMTLIQRY